MSWHDWVTAVVAVYAAVLSTYREWISRKERKRQVQVTWELATVLKGSGGYQAVGLATARNPGSLTVVLQSFALVLPDDSQLYLQDPTSGVKFPYELLEGRACNVEVQAGDMANILKLQGITGAVKLRAQFRDVFRAYRSKPLLLDRESLRKRAAQAG